MRGAKRREGFLLDKVQKEWYVWEEGWPRTGISTRHRLGRNKNLDLWGKCSCCYRSLFLWLFCCSQLGIISGSLASTTRDRRALFFCGTSQDFPGGSDGKESACNAGDAGLIPRSGRSPGGGDLPREFHRQRGLAGYCPWGREELDTTERLACTRPLGSHCSCHTVLVTTHS